MPASPAFGAPLLGQTEKALNAFLFGLLAGADLTEAQWIALTLALEGDGVVDHEALVQRLAAALKTEPARARDAVAALAAAGLLTERDGAGTTSVTARGRELFAGIRAEVVQITERMWGDLPAEDLATAGRVLGTILERANAELAAA